MDAGNSRPSIGFCGGPEESRQDPGEKKRQGVEDEARVIAHRPAHDLTGEQIEDGGQVQPPLIGRDVGDVRQPNLIRPGGQEGLVEQIVGDRQAVIAVGGDDPEAALGHRSDAMAMHQPLDPAAADEASFGAQEGVDARGAVAATVAGMDTPDTG